jgi:hypothetical protein
VLSAPGIYNDNIPTAEGQTFHGDHLYAFYQIPQNAKALPIVMLHGAYQSARSWETTPDGRVANVYTPADYDPQRRHPAIDDVRIPPARGAWVRLRVRVVERGRGARLLDEAAPARLVRGWSPEWQEGAHTRREQSGATLGGTLDQGASMRLLGGFWGFGAPLFEQQA